MKFKIRDLRDKYFQIDNIYLNGYARELGVSTTAVYLSLCRHSNANQKCFPSQKLIAEEHNIDARTVRRAIKKLKKFNIINVTRERTDQGKLINNIYILHDKSIWEKSTRGHQCPLDIQRTNKTKTRGHHAPTNNTNINNTNISLSLPLSQTCENYNLREKILEKLKTHFPKCSIPNSIPNEKLDLFLYKIEIGEIDSTKIRSVSAYLKGLQIESFPIFGDRKVDKDKITEKREEETKKQKAVDEIWQRAEKEFQEADNETREMIFEQAKKKLPNFAKNSQIAIQTEAIKIFQELNFF